MSDPLGQGRQVSFLPVRWLASRKQAEELSLLLQSVGIEVRVSFDEQMERAPWVIAVEAARQAEARRMIDEEDAQPLPAPPEPLLGVHSRLSWVVGLVLVNVVIWWVTAQHGGSHRATTLLHFGAVTSSLLAAGEWWRAVTAMFLHFDARHLIGNMALLSVLGVISLRMWGPGRLLFLYVMSGVMGNGAGFLFGSATAVKAGASGAILGLLGALAGARLRSLRHPRHFSRFKHWHVLAMLLAFYGLIVGSHPNADHVAHIGGLLSGVLMAIFLPPLSGSTEQRFQLAVGVVAVLICLIAGMFAVRAGA